MEIRRILTGKRYIFSVLLLLIINFALFQYNQAETWEILGDDLRRELFVQQLADKQNEEHKQFYERIESISDEVDSLLGISIFADEDSVAYKNIHKTAGDYKKLEGIELSDTNDYAVQVFLEYDTIYVIGLIIVLLTVTAFHEERKNGLWNLIYASKGGRMNLCLKRGVLLMIVSLCASIGLVGGTLALSFINYGGADLLLAPVQSVGLLQNVIMNVTLLEFVTYYIIVYGGCLFLNGLAVWWIMSCIRNKNVSMIIAAAVYFAEWIIYSLFMWSNPLSILKYSNLYFLADPREMYTSYTNFSFCGTLFNLREYVPVFLIGAIAVVVVVHLITAECVRPVYAVGKLERFFNKVCDILRRSLCCAKLTGFELYKQMAHGKGLIIVSIFVVVTVSNIDRVMFVISPARELLDEFYDEHTGAIEGEALAAYEEIEVRANEIYDKGNSEKSAAYNMYEMLQEQKVRADALSARGIEGWFINDRGYELLLKGRGLFERTVDGIVLVLAVILMSSSVYIGEKTRGMDYLLRSTVKGRKQLFIRKSVVTLMMTGLAAMFLYGTQIYEVLLKYKLIGMQAPAQNIEMLEDIGYSLSVGGFLALWFGTRLMIMIAVSCMAMFISSKGSTAERVYMKALLLIPAGVADAMVIGVIQSPHVYVAVIPMIVCIVISGVCLWRIDVYSR